MVTPFLYGLDLIVGTTHLDLNTAMTKRFQNFKNTEKCDEKHEELTLLEAIKSEKEHIARQILLEKQFSNLESQDRRRDGKLKIILIWHKTAEFIVK